jgi:hypothetical protein
MSAPLLAGTDIEHASAATLAILTAPEVSKLAQKLGQLQPFTAVFPQECVGQLAYFGPT